MRIFVFLIARDARGKRVREGDRKRAKKASCGGVVGFSRVRLMAFRPSPQQRIKFDVVKGVKLCYDSTMGRHLTFDYTSPFYYMVTLHAKQGLEPFSILTEETARGLRNTAVTRAMVAVFNWMNKTAYVHRMQIKNYTIMPNHLHFIVKICACEHRVSLLEIVNKLRSTLSNAYYKALHQPHGPSIFEPYWHDWIVKQAGQLDAFVDYVKDNPQRALYRQKHAAACYPRSYPSTHYTWTCLGTLSLRTTPVRVPVICSRAITPGSDLWEEWKALAQRLGPGCLAVGTFMSPCEKMVREEVLKKGGGIVHLIPHGLSPKAHASAEDEPLLATGRLSILTPFPYEAREMTKKELHDRCHTTLHTLARGFLRGIDHLPASR